MLKSWNLIYILDCTEFSKQQGRHGDKSGRVRYAAFKRGQEQGWLYSIPLPVGRMMGPPFLSQWKIIWRVLRLFNHRRIKLIRPILPDLTKLWYDERSTVWSSVCTYCKKSNWPATQKPIRLNGVTTFANTLTAFPLHFWAKLIFLAAGNRGETKIKNYKPPLTSNLPHSHSKEEVLDLFYPYRSNHLLRMVSWNLNKYFAFRRWLTRWARIPKV